MYKAYKVQVREELVSDNDSLLNEMISYIKHKIRHTCITVTSGLLIHSHPASQRRQKIELILPQNRVLLFQSQHIFSILLNQVLWIGLNTLHPLILFNLLCARILLSLYSILLRNFHVYFLSGKESKNLNSPTEER